ncbi:MAG: S1C family serine protease [Erysipelotrichaceae bacterium]
MKKVVTALLAILLGWNVLLTVQLNQLKNGTTDAGDRVVNGVVSDVTSDLTKLVAESEEKVVGITSLVGAQAIGTGSGAVISVEGKTVYVVTNHHVIDGATNVVVTYANGSEVEAEVLGSDQIMDLALLKMQVDFEAKAFKVGDSSLTKKGESVIAMGSPLGLEFQGSVSYGIISGTDRMVGVDLDGNGTDDWDAMVMQTDAAINPGNSGGPLINMAGELIGINSMKISDTNVEGIGFSIPINEVIPVIEQLGKDGKVVRPLLGISARSVSELTTFERNYFKLEEAMTQGLLIAEVSKGSAAELAGIAIGDIMTRFDGQAITSFKDFRRMLYTKKVGDRVSVELYREGKYITKEVTLQ